MINLRQAVCQIVDLSEEDWELVGGYLKPILLKKNSFLLPEGKVCDFIAFVEEGSLVYLQSKSDGCLVTTDFATEGDWVTNNQSRLSGERSAISIKAISDCRLTLIKNEDLNLLYNHVPKLDRLGRLLMEQAFIKLVQHSVQLQSLSAKENYLLLIKQNPKAFQKIPLYHIANYLGIAPKSLSRIRHELSSQK